MTNADLQALLLVRAHLGSMLQRGAITQAQHDGVLGRLEEEPCPHNEATYGDPLQCVACGKKSTDGKVWT